MPWTRHARLSLPLAAAALAACGGGGVAVPCAKRTTGSTLPEIIVTLTGRGVTVPLVLDPPLSCPASLPQGTQVVTEVVDASDQLVPHDTGELVTSSSGYSTTVSFTPRAGGVYFLTARFEPELGLVQRQVQVVVDRTAEPPALELRTAGACDDLAALDEWGFCLNPRAVTVLHGGQVVDVLAVSGAVLAPGALWTWRGPVVTRWWVADGALASAPLRLGAPLPSDAVGAANGRFVGLGGAPLTLQEVVADGAGLREGRRVAVGEGPPTGRVGLLALGADDVAWVALGGRICVATLAPRLDSSCLQAELELRAVEGGGFWGRTTAAGEQRAGLVRVVGEPPRPALALIPAQNGTLADTRRPHPSFAWDGLLVVPRAGDLVLEAWRAPAGTALGGVNGSFVWFTRGDGQTIAFRR